MKEQPLIIRFIVIFLIGGLIVRLFFLQVLADDYKLAAENNIVQKIIEYPYRGLIFDRNNNLIAHNDPIYDLMVVPKEVDLRDSTTVISLLGLKPGEYTERIRKAKRYSSLLPSTFDTQISPVQFAKIQDQIGKVRGFYVRTRTYRSYNYSTMSNALGYVGEISSRMLSSDTTGFYRGGDYVGISGLERQYEPELRGNRGTTFKMVNVRGMVQGDFRDGSFDTLPVPGKDIQITLDLKLQQYAEKLLENKRGSVVAIEPSSGEVLAFVSAPGYDPTLLTGRQFSENFRMLQQDSLKPLFNRPIQAMYPPGSMFKTVQALVALEENQVRPFERIYNDGSLIGDLAPPGEYDITRAITYSSNNFFYQVFRRVILSGENKNQYLNTRVGLEKWREYLNKFGLGRKLGLDIPGESKGYIPTLERYDRIYGTNRWRFSNIYSLSIGQGELLVTPLQMANLGVILANRGYYIQPHMVKSIDGEAVSLSRNDVGINAKHYDVVIDGMEKVIQQGSGIRAYIPDIAICGKTSTVENPPYPDHSGFMGFAPKEDPKIAIAAYVENAGQGGRAAASTASLLIEYYLKGEISRPWLEEYVLNGIFTNARRETTE